MSMYNTSPLSTNIIYGNGDDYHNEDHDYVDTTGPLNNWHDYAIEWTPEYIKWTMDGEIMRTSLSSSTSVNF